MPAVGVVPNVVDRNAGSDLEGTICGCPEQPEQVAPMDAQPDFRPAGVGIAEGEHGPSAAGPALDPTDRGRASGKLVGEAEIREHGLPKWLQEDPGADRSWVRDPLDDFDVVSVAGQQQRRDEPAGAGADHADPKRLHARANNVLFIVSKYNRPSGADSCDIETDEGPGSPPGSSPNDLDVNRARLPG